MFWGGACRQATAQVWWLFGRDGGSAAGKREVLGWRVQMSNGTGLVVIWEERRQRGREERSFRVARADEQRRTLALWGRRAEPLAAQG